ncbi:MAG TPA: ShlB/FhaC/HecB family hemolysin secretion/activation protein [Xanthobacteraceae bacterium]|nr:ShlB/FhaC/HecB family hemolysin secretion/activation protein [Xanthobacteraceae bacterium]
MSVFARLSGLCVGLWVVLSSVALAQTAAPPPSQVRPPTIVPPTVSGHIGIPQVPAGAQIPAEANKLTFKLLGFDIQGEFPELVAQRKEIASPLVGKTITVAKIFEFADKLQQIYVHAGYPLVRVVILPQEFEDSARIKLRVIDGFVERMDLNAIGAPVRARVASVVAPLMRKKHLQQSELERRLLLAGEAPGLILNATFVAGKEEGGSVLVLTGRYRSISASVYADDAMPAAFGTGQVVTTLSENGLAGLGEQLSVSVAGNPEHDFFRNDPNRRYLSATYTMPLGIDGWKLELFATDGRTTPYVTIPGTQTFGVFDQGHVKLVYEAIKRRDSELAFHAMFEPANESLESLAFTPPVPISLDRVRPVRVGFDAIWRDRTAGLTINYGAEFSQGLNAFGARTAANAAQSDIPLSQQGADAVFSKLDGHLEINQALPNDFFATFKTYGQTSFNQPLLLSEQFDIDAPNMLSGFTVGEFFGDAAWVLRGELGRPVSVPIAPVTLIVTPYLFAATGERDIYQPTAVEAASVHVLNYGIGTRFNVPSWTADAPDTYAFVEASNGYVDPVIAPMTNNSSRIFAGILVQH